MLLSIFFLILYSFSFTLSHTMAQTFISLAYFISLCLAVFYVSVSYGFLLRRDVRCYFGMSFVRQIVHMALWYLWNLYAFSFSEQANFPHTKKNPTINKHDFWKIFVVGLFFVDKRFQTITIYQKNRNEKKSHTQNAHSLPEMCLKTQIIVLGTQPCWCRYRCQSNRVPVCECSMRSLMILYDGIRPVRKIYSWPFAWEFIRFVCCVEGPERSLCKTFNFLHKFRKLWNKRRRCCRVSHR